MNNKTIWITGASSGIGKSLALKFAQEGWKVAISARRENLLKELYMFDNLRVDRTTAGFGLEVRIPFLDPELVNYMRRIPAEYRMCSTKKIEKKVLRDSFNRDNILPMDILYRRKEAFSDAVSSNDVSWYQTLCEKYIEPNISNLDLENAKQKYTFNPPQTKEDLYYRRIFEELFPNKQNVI